MLRIRQADLITIHRQACAEYPHECCGVLTTAATASAAVAHPCTNIQQQRHEACPGDYPRNARKAYLIDPQESFNIVSAADRGDCQVVGFYHSHIDCEAYFSAEDRRRAMTFGDEPDYPGAVYVVLSVRGPETGHPQARVVDQKAFAWETDTRDFAAVELGSAS